MEDNVSDHQLFFRLYNRVNARIYSVILIIVHNHNDAEDIQQDAASSMWEKFDQFEKGTNFEAWAIKIAKNKALEFIRKNKKSRMVFDDKYYDMISEYAEKETDDITENIHIVKKCMKKLSETDFKLLNLRFSKNISLKQISTITGRSSSSLCQSFSRILDLLKFCVARERAIQEQL